MENRPTPQDVRLKKFLWTNRRMVRCLVSRPAAMLLLETTRRTMIAHTDPIERIHQAGNPRTSRLALYFVECTRCGFEPADQLSLQAGRCPKCHGFAWHRVTIPGGMIALDDDPNKPKRPQQLLQRILKAG
jgi:predicted Zn-ribbon and HTH transcriptional regulator